LAVNSLQRQRNPPKPDCEVNVKRLARRPLFLHPADGPQHRATTLRRADSAVVGETRVTTAGSHAPRSVMQRPWMPVLPLQWRSALRGRFCCVVLPNP